MIESLIIFAFLTFTSLADPTGQTLYPSGVKECDDLHFNFPPHASKRPNLVLSTPVYDGENKLIPQGIYEAEFSEETGQILLLQSKEIKAKLPVMQVLTTDREYQIPTIKAKNLSSKHVLIIYKYGYSEIQSTLSTP
ncbi:MAG: hypothetical protein ACD_20C00015G0003 [uncultured bacterium]|nr:MAG: hypothetical protein ACD_20C00015G0003 [uncultured bacterium]HBH19258.1 hypothetical protein [Cyanobacteria bacterium UBA9579]